MYGNGCVSECLYNAILVRRYWTVEKGVSGLTYNVRDNDIIRIHVSESPTRSPPGELVTPGRKRLLWRLLERRLLAGDVAIFVEHIYKCFLSVLS